MACGSYASPFAAVSAYYAHPFSSAAYPFASSSYHSYHNAISPFPFNSFDTAAPWNAQFGSTCGARFVTSAQIPTAQLAAPLSTAHFSYNGVAKARTLAASAKAAAANAAAAAEAANQAAAAAAARAKALSDLAESKAAKLQKDLDEVHIAHARIARQTTYPCLSF